MVKLCCLRPDAMRHAGKFCVKRELMTDADVDDGIHSQWMEKFIFTKE